MIGALIHVLAPLCAGVDQPRELVLDNCVLTLKLDLTRRGAIAYKYLYSYIGETPFTNTALTNLAVISLSSGFWGVCGNVSEHWMAFVDEKLWGLGVYNSKRTNFLAGRSGEPGKEAQDDSTSYIAPVLRLSSSYQQAPAILQQPRDGAGPGVAGGINSLQPLV